MNIYEFSPNFYLTNRDLADIMSLTLLTTRSDLHVVKTGERVKKITLLQSRFDGEVTW